MAVQLAIPITDDSCMSECRYKVSQLLADLQHDPVLVENARLIVTEMATNIVKHAGQGIIFLQRVALQTQEFFELLAVDRGPGIADIAQALSDGFSTRGSLGGGLGGIRRLSDVFDIFSLPQQGTVVLSRLSLQPHLKKQQPPFDIGMICQPIAPDEPCGDNWAVAVASHRVLVMVVDGLGHGELAAKVGQQAVEIFYNHLNLSGENLVSTIHAGLRSTRGAALAIAEIDLENRLVYYTGIGNIAARLAEHNIFRHLISHNGIAGAEVRKIQAFTYPWSPQTILIMHSDGIVTHWDFNNYPGLASHHAATISACLFRDFNRQRDDATVLVFKQM